VITGAPNSNRIEMRLPGADTNPYLAIAAVLASVGVGIDREVDAGPPLLGNGYASAGSTQFPRTLGEAAASLRNSATAKECFGDDVVEHYAALGDHEWSTFLAAVSDWDRDRYLDSI
jgi:glutamine synthetase